MGHTDLELLERYVKRRDAEAFAELAARHQDMVYGTCRRLLDNRSDAEDAAQECFLELVRNAARLRRSVAGWLHRVAVRSSLAQRRKDRARERSEREAGRMALEQADEPTWEDIRAQVDHAIDRLPDDLREPVVLHFLQGKPQAVVAEELGLSQPTVSRRLARAVERLRKHLGPAGAALSVAGLAALLGTHAVDAAPATLVANLGRVALAGVAPPSAAPALAGALGHAASLSTGTKTVCVLAVVVAVGTLLQQAARPPAASQRAPAQAATAPADNRPAPTTTPRATAAPSARGSQTSPRSAPAPGPEAPARMARNRPPMLAAAAGGPETEAVAAGPTAPQGAPNAARQPRQATPQPPAAPGVCLYLSPTGVATIADQDGVLATLGIMAFGVGWDPRDQRRAWTGFPVAQEPGTADFTGEIPLSGIEGGRLLYAEHARATATGIELQYDVTFNGKMRVQGFTLTLEVPRERFGGDAVAFRSPKGEEAVITLPDDERGYRLGTAEAEQVHVGPYPEPQLSIAVLEHGVVPLPLRTPFEVVDLRPFDLDGYEVQIGSMMAAGQEVSTDTVLSMKLLVTCPAAGAPPALRPPGVISRPGVRLCHDARVDGASCERIADVVSAAKEACEALDPTAAKEEIRVCVVPATLWRDNLATNRRDTIYLRVRDQEFGQAMRADAGPVGMLCQAVAELYTQARFPGLDWFLAHRYLAPAATGRLGADILPRRNATPLGADGPELLRLLTGDAYAPVHPGLAAARALAAVVDRLGFRGFLALRPAALADTAPETSEFAALRAAATARDPTLAAAFEAYEAAKSIEFDADGTHLIASFETNETVRAVTDHPLRTVTEGLVVTASPGLEVSPSDEWAAQGARSLRVHAERPQPGMYVAIADPDWQLKNWRRFPRFEMDLRLKAPAPERVRVLALDDIGGAHGQLPLFRGWVRPGQPVHVSVELDPEAMGQRQLESECYNDAVRAEEIASLYLDVPHPTGHPLTLYLDNLRLVADASVSVTPRARISAAPRPQTPETTTVRLRGVVIGPDGRPAPGVRVGFFHPFGGPQSLDSVFTARTDAAGAFELQREIPVITPRKSADYYVWAATDDGKLMGASFPGAYGTTPGEPLEVRLQAPGYIRASVTDLNGKPLRDLRPNVALYWAPDPICVEGPPTDERGQVLIGPLPAGARPVITPPVGLYHVAPDDVWQTRTAGGLLIKPGATVELPPLRLDPEGRSVEGVVEDADGKPVAGAQVVCDRPESAPNMATTDAQGRFRLTHLPLPRFEVWLVAADTTRQQYVMAEIEPGGGEPVRLVVRPLTSIGGLLAGADGRPLGDVSVEVLGRLHGVWETAWAPPPEPVKSAPDGSWSVGGLIAGAMYRCCFRVPGGESSDIRGWMAADPRGEPTDLGVITLRPEALPQSPPGGMPGGTH